MASNFENVIPSCFELGDLVYSFRNGNRGHTHTWLLVICPDFGSSGNYTEVKEGHTRLYHVQRLGSSDELEQAWIPQSELTEFDDYKVIWKLPLKVKNVKLYVSERVMNDCILFSIKSKFERIETCKVRAKIFDLKSQLKSMKESLDEKTFMTSQNQEKHQKEQISTEELKNELKSLKDSLEGLKNSVLSQNQDQPKNEQETKSNKKIEQLKNEVKSLKDSFEELKNYVTSQNQDQLQNEQETDSNNENAKEIKLEKAEKVEDHVEELLKLNQIIKDLKIDNLKLANGNIELSKENENYEKVQNQNEALIKSLKEDLLKLSQENAHLKYGQGSKND